MVYTVPWRKLPLRYNSHLLALLRMQILKHSGKVIKVIPTGNNNYNFDNLNAQFLLH